MEIFPGHAIILGCWQCCPAEGTSVTLFYHFGQHCCLNSKHCAVLSFEIKDDGIEVSEWLQDMANLDLQCVVPMAAEHINLVAHFRTRIE
jgi:hypothetical protein